MKNLLKGFVVLFVVVGIWLVLGALVKSTGERCFSGMSLYVHPSFEGFLLGAFFA